MGSPVAGYHLEVFAGAARIVDGSSGGVKLLVLGKMKKA